MNPNPSIDCSSSAPMSSHIKILIRELELRKQKNPKYSLRSFARLLDVDPSMICRVLAGKQALSLRITTQILSVLPLSLEDRESFKQSVVESIRQKAVYALTQQNSERSFRTPKSFGSPIKEIQTYSLNLDSARIEEVKQRLKAFAYTLNQLFAVSEKENTNFVLSLSKYGKLNKIKKR